MVVVEVVQLVLVGRRRCCSRRVVGRHGLEELVLVGVSVVGVVGAQLLEGVAPAPDSAHPHDSSHGRLERVEVVLGDAMHGGVAY
jgi:hypothetical protein